MIQYSPKPSNVCIQLQHRIVVRPELQILNPNCNNIPPPKVIVTKCPCSDKPLREISVKRSSLRGHFVTVSLGSGMLQQFSLDSEFEAQT